MAKPVLLVTRRLPQAVEARARRDHDARLTASDTPIPSAEIIARAQDAAAVLTCPGDHFDTDLIGALPDSVKVIATFSVGYDHVDVTAARERGIAVCNTPDVLSLATAECALLLILAASRRAGEGERLIRAGKWVGWAPTQLMGVGAAGRKLGIFGMGRIGRELARLARGLGMAIHYRDVVRLPEPLEMGAIYHDNDKSFLAECEVLSLNAPGGGSTRHWLNAARGTLVDDAALIAALRTGQVGYAGLDVYDGEPNVHPGYLELENVMLLPHLGSATVETRDAMGFLALDGIDAVLAGKAPSNLVR